MSAIYNLGSSYVAKTLFENKNAMNALLNGTDEEYINYINNEYKKKERNERVKLQNGFNDYKYGGHLFQPGGNTNPIWAKYLTVPEETEEEKNKRITAANTYEVSPQRRVFTKATLAAPDYKTPTSLQSDNTSVSVPVSTVAEQEAIQAQKEAEVRQRIYNNTVRPVSNQEMSDIEHGHRQVKNT